MWWNCPEFLLEIVDKSQEFRNCFKKKHTEDISEELLVCSPAVDPLIIRVGKTVDLKRFSSMDKLLRVTRYVLRFVHNIRSRVMKNLK